MYCLKFWVPKSGGSTIHNKLSGNVSHRKFRGLTTFDFDIPVISCAHYTPTMLAQQNIVSPDEILEAPSFINVRNPWARYVSMFSGMGRDRRRTDDFKAFLYGALNDRAWTASAERISLGTKIKEWFFLGDTELNHLVVRAEHINEDWEPVARMIGSKGGMGYYNQSSHGPYYELYDDESREWVREHDIWAIERFGYCFGEDEKSTMIPEEYMQ